MTTLDPRDADKLARICGLFGSDHEGERATAAAMADNLLRQRGLSWHQIIVPRQSSTIEELIATAMSRPDCLTIWEDGFIRGIRGRQYLTQKQLTKLRDIAGRVADAGD